jgi:hypothetical protein
MGAINFVTLYEANVLQAVSDHLNRLDDISKHGEIRWHELGPSRPILVGGIENVGYIGETTKLLPAVVSIEQIYRNVSDAIGWFSAAARQSDNVPVAERSQMIQKVSADNPLRPHHQRYLIRCAHLKKWLQAVNSARFKESPLLREIPLATLSS